MRGIYWNGFEPEWDDECVFWHDGFTWGRFDGENTYLYAYGSEREEDSQIISIGSRWVLV